MKIFLPLFIGFSLFANEAPRWTYVEVIEGNAIKTDWYYNEDKEELTLKGISTKNEMTIVCSPDYKVKKVVYLTNKLETPQESECLRQGSQLKITINQNGTQSERIHNIGNSIWIQEFGFGLRPFVESNSPEFKFCIINPKDFTINKMVAKKERIEDLTIGDKTYKTQKIKITLQGPKSMFWKAYAWFDAQSYELVQYQGNKGPNTPTSIITLQSAL